VAKRLTAQTKRVNFTGKPKLPIAPKQGFRSDTNYCHYPIEHFFRQLTEKLDVKLPATQNTKELTSH
jgi:hypothetical protein